MSNVTQLIYWHTTNRIYKIPLHYVLCTVPWLSELIFNPFCSLCSWPEFPHHTLRQHDNRSLYAPKTVPLLGFPPYRSRACDQESDHYDIKPAYDNPLFLKFKLFSSRVWKKKICFSHSLVPHFSRQTYAKLFVSKPTDCHYKECAYVYFTYH